MLGSCNAKRGWGRGAGGEMRAGLSPGPTEKAVVSRDAARLLSVANREDVAEEMLGSCYVKEDGGGGLGERCGVGGWEVGEPAEKTLEPRSARVFLRSNLSVL